jgi:hypothetical protein
VGVGVPAAGETPPVDGLTDRLLNSVEPVALTRPEIGRLAAKDKWYQTLQRKYREALETPVPSKTEIQRLWREAAKAYARWILATQQKEWNEESARVIRGQLKRRLIELRENETTRRIHAIKGLLGVKFLLHHQPRNLVLLKRRSRLLSKPPTETSP